MAQVADDVWRLHGRADELRAIADGFRDDGARAALMRLAEEYDRLAKRLAKLTLQFDARVARRAIPGRGDRGTA